MEIDVQHPSDDHKNWPKRRSEALLIDGDKYYRVFDNGEKEEIEQFRTLKYDHRGCDYQAICFVVILVWV